VKINSIKPADLGTREKEHEEENPTVLTLFICEQN
jgi:hypothetical protein